MSEREHEPDKVQFFIDAAWLKVVKGTWSQSDKKTFALGFREGWAACGREVIKEMKEGFYGTRSPTR